MRRHAGQSYGRYVSTADDRWCTCWLMMWFESRPRAGPWRREPVRGRHLAERDGRAEAVVVLHGRSSAERGAEVPAGLLAASAGLGADAAVLVHGRMTRALVAAGLAGGGAGFEHRSGQVRVVAGVPGEDPAHGVTDVGAVEIRADALPEFGDHVLAQACVGAGGARLGALDACLDALAQFVAIDSAQVLGIGVEHLRCDGYGGLLLALGDELLGPRGFAGPRPLPGQGPSMARIRLAPPRPGLHTTSRPGAELLPHAWLTTDHHRQVSTFHVGGQRRSTVFTGIGWDSWVRG